ncbi:MAG: O-antigen ligase family protein [Streptosporangiaceae bacterium]
MTTTVRPTPGLPPPSGPAPSRRSGAAGPQRTGGWLARHPAWPVTGLLLLYPLWWALGLADFLWILLAIPMTARMVAWRRFGNRRIRVPPGFGLWLLFLVCAVAGMAALTLTAPGTVPSAISHRVLSWTDRTMNYAGVTVMLLFAGNLTEKELPRRRFAWLLGLVAIFTTIGGLAGMAAPHLQFNSPLLLVLPKSVQSNTFIQASMQPGLAQVQNVLGTAGGRPKAPFDYTNLWGDCLTILVPFLIVGWWQGGTRRQRWIAATTITLAIVPLLYSLNRGAWIGVGFAIGYLAVRLAARGRVGLLGGLIALIALAGVLVLATPLQSIVTGRLHHGKSDNLRSELGSLSVKAALASPIIGYGDTRQEKGSPESIAVGPGPKCPSCGHLAVGSTGQLWLLLVCSGFVGAGLYLAFFLFGIWRYRHERSPYAVAGVLVLLLSFLYMFTYDAVGAPLGFTILIYALMWKDSMFRQAAEPPAAPRALRPGAAARLGSPA